MIEWYICFIECLWASHVTIYKVFTTVLAYRKCSVKAEFIIIFTVILCDPINGFHQAPCPWDSPGMNTGTGCHSLLQGIFPTHKSNLHLLGLLHCRQILSLMSHCTEVGCKGSYPQPSFGDLPSASPRWLTSGSPVLGLPPHSSQSMPGWCGPHRPTPTQ